MNLEEYKQEISKIIDKNNMVVPQQTWTNSGNGLLYTGEAIAIANLLGNTDNNYLNYDAVVRSCYYKKGCLMRTPDNAFGQQQWDDYLGVALGCLATKNTKIPREILFYACTHLFIMDTNGKVESKDFLGRFVHVWLLMAAAAFPILRFILNPVLRGISKYLQPKKPQGSGDTNLQLNWFMAMRELGMPDLYENFVTYAQIRDHFSEYFNRQHPFFRVFDEEILDQYL